MEVKGTMYKENVTDYHRHARYAICCFILAEIVMEKG